MNNYYLKRALAFAIDLSLTALIGIILDELPFFKGNRITPMIVFFLFFLKDLVSDSGSYGKKICGLKLVSNNLISTVLRNVFLIIWPIEGLFVLILKKRIGDMLFKTEVIDNSMP